MIACCMSVVKDALNKCRSSSDSPLWGIPPFGFYYRITGGGLVHLIFLLGFHKKISTMEWNVLLLWSVAPILYGLLHRVNPVIWILFNPCVCRSEVLPRDISTQRQQYRICGVSFTTDATINTINWMSLIAGSSAILLKSLSVDIPEISVPVACLLFLANASSAWMMYIQTKKVSYLVGVNDQLEISWRGMSTLAYIYSLWIRFKIPLNLAQMTVLLSGKMMSDYADFKKYLIVGEVILFFVLNISGYFFHFVCLDGLEELTPPPVQLKRHCILFGFIAAVDLLLKIAEFGSLFEFEGDFRNAEKYLGIVMFSTVALAVYALSLALMYLTYNRRVLDDVLILMNAVGLCKTSDGHALVPEWMYSQLSHPSTTILCPFILYFVVVGIPTIVVINYQYFCKESDGNSTIFNEVLLLDMLIGFTSVLLYFGSFLTESLLSGVATRRAFFLSVAFAFAVIALRLYSPFQLSEKNDGKGSELSDIVLYSMIVRNTLFWAILSLAFWKGIKVVGSTLISGSLWASVGFHEGYLESIEAKDAANHIGRPASTLLLMLVFPLGWDVVIWVICRNGSLCKYRSILDLKISVVFTVSVMLTLFLSVAVIRFHRPMMVGPLYCVDYVHIWTFIVVTSTGIYHMVTANTDDTPIKEQIYAVGAMRLFIAVWILYFISTTSRIEWHQKLKDCLRANLRIVHGQEVSRCEHSDSVSVNFQSSEVSEEKRKVSMNFSNDRISVSVNPEIGLGPQKSSSLLSSSFVEAGSYVWLRKILPDGGIEWVCGHDINDHQATMMESIRQQFISNYNPFTVASIERATISKNIIGSEILCEVKGLPFEAKRDWLYRCTYLLLHQRRSDSTNPVAGMFTPSTMVTDLEEEDQQLAHTKEDEQPLQSHREEQPDLPVSNNTAVPQMIPWTVAPYMLSNGIYSWYSGTNAFPSVSSSWYQTGFSSHGGSSLLSQVTNSWQQPWHRVDRRQFLNSLGDQLNSSNTARLEDHCPQSVLIEVFRSNLLESSVKELEKLSHNQWIAPFRVRFSGEGAVDAGGVSREWFQLLSEDLFSPSFGLFIPAPHDCTKCSINPKTAKHFSTFTSASKIFSDMLSAYKFVGKIMAKTILDQKSLPVHFTRDIYKHILGLPVSFRDFTDVDLKLAENLNWLMSHQNVEVLDLDFAVVEKTDKAWAGRERVEIIDLLPNGREIPVTDSNKHHYIKVATKYKMLDRVSLQLAALLNGFYSIVQQHFISVFHPNELKLLLSGLDTINLDDWRNHTVYVGTLRPSHKLVKWFWEVVEEFDQSERSRLLQFVTGSSRVPVGGMGALRGFDGQQRLFTLAMLPKFEGGVLPYPTANTCFNRLNLPMYEDLSTLCTMLTEAIHPEHICGFGSE